jgi:hypothetical protein
MKSGKDYNHYGKINMGINRYAGLWLGMISVLLLSSRCDRSNKIDGIPVTQFYDTCDLWTSEFGQLVSVGDPEGRFIIKLPYNWDISESYSDTLYGIVAANFFTYPRPEKDRMSISVKGYRTDQPAVDYYQQELKALKKDKSYKVLETGTASISEMETYWLMFSTSTESPVYNLVVYFRKENNEEVYIIQSSVYSSDNYLDKLCYMKQLIKTFEILD